MHYYELPNFTEMQVLLETFKQPWVGWQFDTGHLQIMENLGLESIQAWLDDFGKRLIGLHFHDVDGIDDHIAPGLGCTNFVPIGKYIQPHTQITLEVKPFVTPEEILAGISTLENNNCIFRI
jgi:sugar phosphate isomerase/epimerase